MNKAYIDTKKCDSSPMCPARRSCPEKAICQEKLSILRRGVAVVDKEKEKIAIYYVTKMEDV